MNSQSKDLLVIVLQLLGALFAFAASLVISNMISPLSTEITAAGKAAAGFLDSGAAFLFNMLVNAAILVWAGRRSTFKGLRMVGQLFVLSFGSQVFMTQIETGYFISAFPVLRNNFQLYNLVWPGLMTSLLFSFLVTLIVGGFSKKDRPRTAFTTTCDIAVKHGAWLSVIYVVLYFLFGYFVAWQAQDLRLFYGGPVQLNGFLEQWGATLMSKPEIPVFQYLRGSLWLLCLIPLFLGFSGKRLELVILSGLAFALLPTAQLSFPNTLMPAAVSLAHFWQVAISTGIFGALCAWYVPQTVNPMYERAR